MEGKAQQLWQHVQGQLLGGPTLTETRVGTSKVGLGHYQDVGQVEYLPWKACLAQLELLAEANDWTLEELPAQLDAFEGVRTGDPWAPARGGTALLRGLGGRAAKTIPPT